MADGYNPWITLKKFVYGAINAVIPILFLYTIEWFGGAEVPVSWLPYVPLIVGIIVALENWWKHKND